MRLEGSMSISDHLAAYEEVTSPWFPSCDLGTQLEPEVNLRP